MRSVLDATRRQRSVYWAKTGHDGEGMPTFSAGVGLYVRWEDTTENIIAPDGREVVSTATVYVDRAMDIEGMLYKGEYYDLTDAQKADPNLVADARQIIKYEQVDALTKNKTRRVVYL